MGTFENDFLKKSGSMRNLATLKASQRANYKFNLYGLNSASLEILQWFHLHQTNNARPKT